MPYPAERFDLDAFLQPLGQAAAGLFCHILFDAALHGLLMALVVLVVGLILNARQKRFGPPLLAVARKLTLFCVLMSLPGAIYLLQTHNLPSTGAFHISSLGFMIFWTWISLHLSAEEMNFEWFKGPS